LHLPHEPTILGYGRRYVLADKTRKVYNTDKFLVPVATAYGEWDGVEKFGMLRAEEIDILSAKADVAKALPSLMMIASEAKKKASCDRSLPKHPSKSQIKSRCLSLDMEQARFHLPLGHAHSPALGLVLTIPGLCRRRCFAT
jgi:hypothetical protein